MRNAEKVCPASADLLDFAGPRGGVWVDAELTSMIMLRAREPLPLSREWNIIAGDHRILPADSWLTGSGSAPTCSDCPVLLNGIGNVTAPPKRL